MTKRRHPPTSPPQTDVEAAHLVLDELANLGMEQNRGLLRVAGSNRTEPTGLPRIAEAYARNSRAVRRAIALVMGVENYELDEFEEDFDFEDGDFDEFELPDFHPGFQSLSLTEQIAEICRDIGLAAQILPASFRSSARPEILAVCAKAARPQGVRLSIARNRAEDPF
jgi:hypothetical protein